ncbi:TolC family protein [Galbibacter sp. EGI 63066]|uniref:TolC family protein n=1 Tax=Galbibacter sp. EGI 63066 TaxID=2993559 RepID=UPI002249904B|nr:TolC family protein [Galbibacter sp. EGI 63066]MCX2679994.1 TolC family protein [Galbibacter sp. EGI 63066]
MNYSRLGFLLIFLMVHACVFSQELLTKDGAVSFTLDNNLGVKIANNEAEIAENNAGVLNSGYLPRLTGNAGANFNRENTEGTQANGDVRSAEGVETKRYNASLDLNYTLFDGLGRHYNYKALKEQSNLSELQVRETIENTILQLFSVYYEVARLTENTANLKQALEISKDRLQRAQYQFEYGQNTGLDVLNAEVDVNTDSINLLQAQQTLRNTKRDLNLIMNRDLSVDFEVDTTVNFVPNLLMEDVLRRAKENNVVLLQAEKGLLINDYSYKAAKGGFLPTIGLTGSYGWNKSENGNPLAFTTESTTTGLSAGLNLSWNLFDGGTNITQVKNAKIRYKNQELQKKQVALSVERDIRNAWETYENALFILEAQEKNVVTGKNNFNRTEERYKFGTATSLEFRQAQINLLNAVLERNRAKYTAKLAELQALQVSGQLLNVDF